MADALILTGDCRAILPTLDAESVRCCITSPPYWRLRSYGIGAEHGEMGLEETLDEYVAALVGVFREVRRCLSDDGTLWLNCGDSYARNPGRGVKFSSGPNRGPDVPPGMKEKDLVGLPWMLAFALRADGWFLRSEIIWEKPSVMPESVRDRPTRSHEHIFLLAKSAQYFFDQEAVKEPASPDTHARYARGRSDSHKWADGGPGDQTIARTFEHMRAPGVNPKATAPGLGIKNNESFSAAVKDIVENRNIRTVWRIARQGTPDLHFATFPEALAERCILAGSAQGDVVLDPFFGSGTVGKVAERLGRKWVGIELSPEYVKIAERKTAQRGLE